MIVFVGVFIIILTILAVFFLGHSSSPNNPPDDDDNPCRGLHDVSVPVPGSCRQAYRCVDGEVVQVDVCEEGFDLVDGQCRALAPGGCTWQLLCTNAAGDEMNTTDADESGGRCRDRHLVHLAHPTHTEKYYRCECGDGRVMTCPPGHGFVDDGPTACRNVCEGLHNVNVPVPGSCRFVYNCVDGQPGLRWGCGEGRDLVDGVCPSIVPGNCTWRRECTAQDGAEINTSDADQSSGRCRDRHNRDLAHEMDPQKFYRCVCGDGREFKCPDGFEFTSNPGPVWPNTCIRSGVL